MTVLTRFEAHDRPSRPPHAAAQSLVLLAAAVGAFVLLIVRGRSSPSRPSSLSSLPSLSPVCSSSLSLLPCPTTACSRSCHCVAIVPDGPSCSAPCAIHRGHGCSPHMPVYVVRSRCALYMELAGVSCIGVNTRIPGVLSTLFAESIVIATWQDGPLRRTCSA